MCVVDINSRVCCLAAPGDPVFLRKIYILGIAEYFLIVLFQISEIKKDETRFKKYTFFARYVFDCRGRVPVTGMLAGMNLSKPGINLSKPGMNLSKPGKKHRNHVIILNKPMQAPIYVSCNESGMYESAWSVTIYNTGYLIQIT